MKESEETNREMVNLKDALGSWEPEPRGKMYLVMGLPRAGKSTWIKANKDKGIVVSNDGVRESILHSGYSKSTNPAIWMITDGCARIVLSQGKNVIIDGVNGSRFVRKCFTDMARECKAEIEYVWITTPLEMCLERNDSEHKLPDETLIKMANGFEDPDSSEDYDKLSCNEMEAEV